MHWLISWDVFYLRHYSAKRNTDTIDISYNDVRNEYMTTFHHKKKYFRTVALLMGVLPLEELNGGISGVCLNITLKYIYACVNSILWISMHMVVCKWECLSIKMIIGMDLSHYHSRQLEIHHCSWMTPHRHWNVQFCRLHHWLLIQMFRPTTM